jgi:ElaB/YqjD/DUF883 family membrane-anchored ribosome-binding protein
MIPEAPVSKSSHSHDKLSDALELLKEASRDKQVELSELVGDFIDNAKHARDKAVQKAKHAANQVDRSAHDNPWPYIGGAALGGFLIGFLIRSKR